MIILAVAITDQIAVATGSIDSGVPSVATCRRDRKSPIAAQISDVDAYLLAAIKSTKPAAVAIMTPRPPAVRFDKATRRWVIGADADAIDWPYGCKAVADVLAYRYASRTLYADQATVRSALTGVRNASADTMVNFAERLGARLARGRSSIAGAYAFGLWLATLQSMHDDGDGFINWSALGRAT